MHRRASNPMVLEALMKLPLAGSCQCGIIRYEITEAPQLVYTCRHSFPPFCPAADIQA